MNLHTPVQIQLTKAEQQLYDSIIFFPNGGQGQGPFDENLDQSCESACALFTCLVKRDAIPHLRWTYFTEPEYNIGSAKSKWKVMLDNAGSTEAAVSQPDFLKYLWYFIHGPRLPLDIIQELKAILEEDRGTSGEVLNQITSHTRRCIRARGLNRTEAAEELLKLAIEWELGEHMARCIRDAAKNTR